MEQKDTPGIYPHLLIMPALFGFIFPDIRHAISVHPNDQLFALEYLAFHPNATQLELNITLAQQLLNRVRQLSFVVNTFPYSNN